MIKGGTNFDYIDAGMGNDTIRAGVGVDYIDGNTGIDEVRIEGRGEDWDVYKMEDDTLFFVDKVGINFVEADNVESVSFQKEINSHTNHYAITDTSLVDHRIIMKVAANGDKEFLAHTEGSENDDVLTGQRVFACAGDDTINGTDMADTLHAGRGNDIIYGLDGNDRLYGAEGDDILNGGAGNDILIGGIGNDTFVFDSLSGNDVIDDFNNDSGCHDTIELASGLFTDTSALSASITQNGDNVFIALGNLYYLTVENCMAEDVLSACVIL